jgi:CheY-like chemotaxis protein
LLSYFWKVSKKIKSILLVDDDSDDQLLFQEALAEVDGSVRCITAVHGMDAIEKLNTSPIFPDLIIMDVNMPIMNGMECLKAMKDSDEFRAIPVMMYSTSCSRDSQKECFDIGASGYMEKPSDYKLLCSQIKNILNAGFAAIQKTPVVL